MALNKDRIFKAADKYIRSNKIEKAIGEYETWLRENPKDWNTIRIVGDLYARISRNDEAIKKYAQVAEHYRRDGFNVRAIATYKMVLRLDPGNESAMRNLAELQAEEGLLMEAKSYYQTLVELYSKQGHKRLASEVFKKLAEIDPQDLKIRYKFAEFLTKNGKPDEAATEFVGIADQFIGQGKVDEAIKILEQGRSMAPTDPTLQIKLAQALTLQGNHTQAIRFLEDVRGSRPNDPNLLGRLGDAYLAAGNTESAESAFQQLIDLDPANPSNVTRLAELRIAQGKLDTALEQLTPLVDRRVAESDSQKATDLLQKVLVKEPYHVKTLLKLAEVYTILKNDSGRIAAYDNLCEAYSRAGDFEKAVQVAEQLVELDPESSQHKDRLKFLKSRLDAPAKPEPPAAPAAPKPAPPPESEPSVSFDDEIPELDLGEDDLSQAVSESFGEDLSLDQPESAPSSPAVAPLDLGDVVELTQEDEENIKEKLTEAEVFVRYGLVDKAIAQLVDVLESFRFHTESREKLIEIYKDQGMNREAAEQLLHLGQAYDKLGQPQEAERARGEAATLDPALASQATGSTLSGHEELELTLESEADLSDAGIDIDVPAPEEPLEIAEPAAASAHASADEIPLAVEDEAFEEPEIDIAIDEPVSAAEEISHDVSGEIPLDVDLTGEEVDFLAGGEPEPLSNESSDEISVSIEEELPDAAAPAEGGVEPGVEDEGDLGDLGDVTGLDESLSDIGGLGEISSDTDIEIDLPVSEDGGLPVEVDTSAESPEPPPEPVGDLDEGPPQIDVSFDAAASESPSEDFAVELENESSEEGFAIDLDPPDSMESEDVEEPFSQSLEGLPDDEGPDIAPEIPDVASESRIAHAPEPELSTPSVPSKPEPPPPTAVPEPPPAPEVPLEARESPAGAGFFAAELLEVDEYIALGLYEDARDSLRELLKQNPEDVEVLAKIEELGFSVEQIRREAGEQQRLVAPAAPPVKSAAPEPARAAASEDEEGDELAGIESLVAPSSPAPAPAADPGLGGGAEDFIDLASELSEELFGTHSAVEEEEEEAEGPLTDPGLDQIFREFRKGVEKQLGTEDYDTRYNLGIAYKEMGLLDEAIAEFQLAAKDEVRALECCSMLGLCFMEKGMPDIAVRWFSKGLDIPGRRDEEYHGLRYDLAQAYEASSQPEKALALYMEIFRDNAGFRDVKDRVRELSAARK